MGRPHGATLYALSCLLLAACGTRMSLDPRHPYDTTNTSAPEPVAFGSANAAGAANYLNNRQDEVGLLFSHYDDGSIRESCTGTLIRTAGHDAHNIVMTAKHCTNMDTFYTGVGRALQYPNDKDWAAATVGMTSYTVIESATIGEGNVLLPVCPHPSTDIQILLLDRDVPDIVPATLAVAPPQLGDHCKFVGFGLHKEPVSGRIVEMLKRSIDIPIGEIGTLSVGQDDVSGGAPGNGDSGGPLFCGKLVAAADSCGIATNPYTDTNQSFSRVDVEETSIDQLIGRWTAATHPVAFAGK